MAGLVDQPIGDVYGRPANLLRRADVEQSRSVITHPVIVSPETPVRDVVRRAMQRPETARFDPVICALADGRCLGMIPIERVVAQLAR
jgi:hypothetical protein